VGLVNMVMNLRVT